MNCTHDNLRCLGPYTIFRKYICENCSKVFICECEKEIAQTFLPHQITSGIELGTGVRYPVDGFLPNICESCRGEPETPYPMRYGTLIDRYYWREITKTYYTSALEWIKANKVSIKNIVDFEKRYPKISSSLKKDAKKKWRDFHKNSPKYNTTELIDENKLNLIKKITEEIKLTSITVKENKRSKQKWIIDGLEYDRIESAIAHHYKTQGFTVWYSELRLISALIGVYCTLASNYDPGIDLTLKHLTKNWEERNRVDKHSLLTKQMNYGTREYYLRQELEVEQLIKTLNEADDLYSLFESLIDKEKRRLEQQKIGAPYWTSLDVDEYGLNLTRDVVKNLPKEIILKLIEYAVYYFYGNRQGWPDLLCIKDSDYLFVEVKSPTDNLRPEQIDWLSWAFKNGIKCKLCNIV